MGVHLCVGIQPWFLALDFCKFKKEYVLYLPEQEDIWTLVAQARKGPNSYADVNAPFTKQEIGDVVMHFPSEKAPGPDGFNGVFIKACWSIILMISIS